MTEQRVTILFGLRMMMMMMIDVLRPLLCIWTQDAAHTWDV